MKLYDPTSVAMKLMEISHQVNRCPLKKKSRVERV